MKQFTVELMCEHDGRWIAEVPAVPGVMVYGSTKEEAIEKVQKLLIEVLRERGDNGESPALVPSP